MSSRRKITDKPRATVSEIVEQDRIIRAGFEARIGAPLPVPLRVDNPRLASMGEQDRYIEARIAQFVNMFAKNGLKLKKLNGSQRAEWWAQYEYALSEYTDDPTLDEIENAKWDAYCVVIGLPASSRIGRMFPMLPDDRHPPKEWPIEVVASVTSGKLLCHDLAEFVQFMVWFAGGWPDTFAGELDKAKAHRLLVNCCAAAILNQWTEQWQKNKSLPKTLPDLKDVAHITPTNSLVTMKLLLKDYPGKVTLRPANFTELMKLSGVS